MSNCSVESSSHFCMMTELSLFGRPANKIRLPEIHNETREKPSVRQTDCCCSDSVSRRGKGRTPPKVYTTAVTEAAPMLYRTFIHSSSVAPRVTTSSVRRMCFPRISAFRTGENAPTGLARRSSPFKEDWGLVRRVRTRRRARGLPEKRAIRRAIY